MDDAELARLKAQIDQLHTLYFVLFTASLAVLGLQMFVIGFGSMARLVWFLLLAGAVGVRFYRTSLVKRYNAAVTRTLQ